MSLRSKLARVLDGIGVIQAALHVRSMVSTPWLTTLCYHRTAERSSVSEELDGNVIDATPAQFDQQMKFLSEHFTFVGVDEVVAFVEKGAKLPKNPVLVTFDDGYKECFTQTLPILERYGARAAFFIATQHMTERKMFWWDRFAWVVRHSERPEVRLDYPEDIVLPLGTEKDRALAHRRLTSLVKLTRGLDLPRFMDMLDEAAGTTLSAAEERAMVDRVLMTWDEVQGLAKAGMSIGSHCYSHRVLQTLEPKDYDRELNGSKRELEERLGIPVPSLAYPVGYPLEDHAELRRAIADAGYAIGFTTRAGVFGAGKIDRYDVPRILMDTSFDLQHFSAMATLPPLAPRSSSGVMRRA